VADTIVADGRRSQSRQSRRRRARQRRLTGIALGVVVVAGGGTAAVAATASHGASLELATAQLSKVTETVEASGTIASSAKATPAFPVAGTVKSVDVQVGQSVTKGQTLATLDPTSLNSAIDSAASTLATAKQRLEADQTGQTSTAGAAGGAIVTTAYITLEPQAGGSNSGGGSTAPSLSDLITRIVAAQTAVINAQKAVDTAQTAIDAAQHTVDADVTLDTTLRDAQQVACPSPPSTDPITADCNTAMANYEGSADTLAADTATLDTTITAQDNDLKTLDSKTTALDQLLSELRAAASSSTGSTGAGSGAGSGGTGPGGTSSGTTGTGGTGGSATGAGGTGSASGGGSQAATPQPSSASQLAADQASIDAAQAQLDVAEQNLAAATLTSPTPGKVAAIGLEVGANSAGAAITIVGTGSQQVQATVPLTQIALVKAGQPVSISVDGVATQLRGTVTSIGLLSSTSGSTTAFPVTITFAAGSPPLFDGSGADVVITTGTASNVLTVPNSAIHSGVNGSHSVSVYAGGKASVVQVKLGLEGTDVTEVTGGLEAGQEVVIADLSTGLPGSSTTPTTTGFPGGAAGFGGARLGGTRPGG
jgi:HlyD family secretion protein